MSSSRKKSDMIHRIYGIIASAPRAGNLLINRDELGRRYTVNKYSLSIRPDYERLNLTDGSFVVSNAGARLQNILTADGWIKDASSTQSTLYLTKAGEPTVCVTLNKGFAGIIGSLSLTVL